MARVSFGCTLRTTFASNGGYAFSSGATGAIPSQAAVEAAIAVLEADGASPTQAHVNSLRTVWNTLVTGLNAHDTADMVIDYNDANLTTKNATRAALAELARVLEGR